MHKTRRAEPAAAIPAQARRLRMAAQLSIIKGENMFIRFVAGTLLATAIAAPALAQSDIEGYLCCNMRTDGKWISDINYAGSGLRVIPLGTPVKATGYGRYRVHVDIDGSRQAIGNDYSRDIDLPTFARRYIVPEDPRVRMAGFPPRIRQAIESARVTRGMTREQAFMAVGYPVSSENPELNANVLRFWRDSFSEFQLVFDEEGKVKDIVAEPTLLNLVVLD